MMSEDVDENGHEALALDSTMNGQIRTLNGEIAGDEFAADAMNYQTLLGKIDTLLERLNLDAQVWLDFKYDIIICMDGRTLIHVSILVQSSFLHYLPCIQSDPFCPRIRCPFFDPSKYWISLWEYLPDS